MSHFNKNLFKFLEQLAKNNNKEWFDKNRPTYETEIKAPFKSFVSLIQEKMAKEQPEFQREPSKAIFRINKDIRFSKDKSPYKTHVAAFFSRGGTKDERPGFYLHIGADGVFIGGGMYQISKEQLAKVRQEIFYNEKAFSKIINEKKFKSIYGTIKGERNKILPEEYKEFAKEQPLIANKQFYFSANLTKEDVLGNDFDKIVLAHFKAAYAFNDFLMQAITE